VKALLRGHAIPAQLAPQYDHTYVTSEAGDAWGCHGRSSGGAEICTGTGDVSDARDLAGSDGEAGLRWGVTGLCHQMANRILWPAQRLVAAARGYSRWSIVFTAYGLGRWEELQDLLAKQDEVEKVPGTRNEGTDERS